MKQTKLDITLETDLSADEFNKKLLEWFSASGWEYGCIMRRVNENGNKIIIKIESNAK
ncbi:hypothetical protein [Clostridium sp. JN-9]|uniref:hypothetical protein n=1 Tax=Clostridium sp. JN-9 TaxID=2507159 RepID=UPI0013E8DD4B|nr:hypothetical protein [Clostridium sp. JN-9]